MAWEIEKMDGEYLHNKQGHIPIDRDDIYETGRGDFVEIDIELIRFTCPVCKKEKFTLCINGYVQYGGSCSTVSKGKETYSCGCYVFKDLVDNA